MMRYLVAILCLLLSAMVFSDAARAERRVALIIGNGAYETIQVLRNSAGDARLMAQTLTGLGFEVTLDTDADRRTMARHILDFGRTLSQAGPDAVGLFFYAGHGVQAAGTNYLLPVGSQVDTEADLVIEAVDANWVLAQMNEAGNGLNIVILDACRNNPFEGAFRSATRGLARLDAPTGSLVAYSAAPGQAALDGDGDNSPYTHALVEAMREPGTELLQVFRRVRLNVEAQTGGRQTPWEEQSLRSDFYFADGTQAGAEPEIAVADPAPADSGDAFELAFWSSVKDTQNPAMIQTYLARYPNGIFAELARVMVAALGPAETSARDEERARESLDPDLPRHIQAALEAVGCDPGPVDGLWGLRSQRALDGFAAAADITLPREAISEATLDLIEGFDGRCVARQTATPAPQAPQAPQAPAERTFVNPTVAGLPLDICVSALADCRGEAALRYCRDQGYQRLVEHAIVIYPETAHITGGTCKPRGLIVCGGYSRIVCAR
jgi:hypothetical protein